MRFPLQKMRVIGYDYGSPTSYSPQHLGVDWEADFVPLYAPTDGTIINILTGPAGGKTIWFRPKGEEKIIRWLHLSKFLVVVSQQVKEGQQLAITGNSGTDGNGHAPLSHLHEDMWKKSVTLKFKDTLNPHEYYKGIEEPMKIVNDNGTYFLVGERGKLGLNGIEALQFFKKLTDKEEAGSTANIPQVAVFENHLGV